MWKGEGLRKENMHLSQIQEEQKGRKRRDIGRKICIYHKFMGNREVGRGGILEGKYAFIINFLFFLF